MTMKFKTGYIVMYAIAIANGGYFVYQKLNDSLDLHGIASLIICMGMIIYMEIRRPKEK